MQVAAEQAIDATARHRALIALAHEYAEEARFGLQASPASARSVLERLAQVSDEVSLRPLLLKGDHSPLLTKAQTAARGIHEELTPDIIALAKGSTPELTELAVRLLRVERGGQAEQLLQEALRGPFALAALAALAHSPSEQALRLIEDSLSDTTDWALRRRFALSLGEMKPRTSDAALQERIDKTLTKLAADPHEIVRQEARKQLGKTLP